MKHIPTLKINSACQPRHDCAKNQRFDA